METDLYTSEQVLQAFPWISSTVLHHRIKKGFLPIKRRSTRRGVFSQFSWEELIHAGVLDIQATLGLFGDPKRVSASIADIYRPDLPIPEGADPLAFGLMKEPVEIGLGSPFDLETICRLYRRHQMNVVVRVDTTYSKGKREYYLIYKPESFIVEADQQTYDTVQHELNTWRKEESYGEKLSLTLISVRRVAEHAVWNLRYQPLVNRIAGGE
jgi:hypothetical protein